jgi:energy-coupling factor transporter transmembrane protein EcfT
MDFLVDRLDCVILLLLIVLLIIFIFIVKYIFDELIVWIITLIIIVLVSVCLLWNDKEKLSQSRWWSVPSILRRGEGGIQYWIYFIRRE